MRWRNNNPIILIIEFLFRNELLFDSMWFYFIFNSIIKCKIRQKCYCTDLVYLWSFPKQTVYTLFNEFK